MHTKELENKGDETEVMFQFEDTGILPKDSQHFQEAKDIFCFAVNNSDMPVPVLIAALLRLKIQVNHDEDEFIEGMRQFKIACEIAQEEQQQ